MAEEETKGLEFRPLVHMKGFFITLLPSQSTIEVTFLPCVTKNKPGVLEESKTRPFEAVSGLSSFNVLLVKSSKFTDTRNKLPELPLQSCPVRDQSKGSSSLTDEVRADMECETGVVRGIKNLEASTDVAEKWCKARGFGLFQEG
ncbi:hypothetical protein BY996DRAFT_6600750 [Phakopsora pachyrhizi]|nr:hypothetical protein BY996DRAFT_6600750 [Phakopsora pachyrhizi]